jgi:hypothetical protein
LDVYNSKENNRCQGEYKNERKWFLFSGTPLFCGVHKMGSQELLSLAKSSKCLYYDKEIKS